MKKLVLLLTVIFFVSSVIAQDKTKKDKEKTDKKGKPTMEQRAQKSVDNLNKAVTLTADQKTKVYALALERSKKHEAITNKYKGKASKEDKEAAKKEFMEAHKEYRAAVKAILTTEQVAKLKEKAKKEKKNDKKGKTKDKEPEVIVEELIPSEE